MRRRQVLATLGLAALAGCSGGGEEMLPAGGGDPTSTATPTDTPTASPAPSPTATPRPTQTPTPELQVPEFQFANLVSNWREYGDAFDNAVDSIGAGGIVRVGFRYDLFVHGGELDVTVQARVFDEDGSRIGNEQRTDSQIFDQSGTQPFEWFVPFDSRSWETGSYRATIVARDNVAEETSGQSEVEFEIVEPLRPAEVSLVDATPTRVAVGEQFGFEVTLRNESDRDASVVTPVSIGNGESFQSTDSTFRLNIPAGGTATWLGGETSIRQSGSVTYRLNDVDISWELTVEE